MVLKDYGRAVWSIRMDAWRDGFSTGDVIGAQPVDLEFGSDPREQLPRLTPVRDDVRQARLLA